MQKSVLISIQPKWVEKIASGEKTIEVRKTKPNWQTPFKVYIYATRPKKWFRYSSFGRASEESLWLSNGKVEMCDGFKFWTDGIEYESLCGKVIGEFICNRIDDFYCASVPYQKENNLGYGHFVDNGVYKVNGWHEGIVFERNDRYIDTMLNNNDLKEMCLSAQEVFDYIGIGKHLFGWHISDLKIYDKPKELSEFKNALSLKDIRCKYIEKRHKTYNGKPYMKCTSQNCVCEFRRLGSQTDCDAYAMLKEQKPIERPPQSWCYVED